MILAWARWVAVAPQAERKENEAALKRLQRKQAEEEQRQAVESEKKLEEERKRLDREASRRKAEMDKKAREIEQRRRQLEEQLQAGHAVDVAQLDSVLESPPRLRSSSLG